METSSSVPARRLPFTDHIRIPLRHLAWPILIENLLRVSLSSVDVLMLSFYSDKAVAAVGLINQFVLFIQLPYLMVATGASILISQHLGARQGQSARPDQAASAA
ncbi:MAG: hypothetical protein JXA71_11120, partial [Chitinispirillaceae bacterium]|nr:hypothetical protein [Chitinispirillaceae bacterium]